MRVNEAAVLLLAAKEQNELRIIKIYTYIFVLFLLSQKSIFGVPTLQRLNVSCKALAEYLICVILGDLNACAFNLRLTVGFKFLMYQPGNSLCCEAEAFMLLCLVVKC